MTLAHLLLHEHVFLALPINVHGLRRSSWCALRIFSMWISKLQYRWLFIAVVLILFLLGSLHHAHLNVYTLSLYLGTGKQSELLEADAEQRSWLYAGPNAQDKAVVMARTYSEDVSWAYEHLSE